MKVAVFKLPQRSPDDVAALQTLIQNQQLDPAHIVAIVGKTEGNGCVNDFTRGYAVQTLKAYLKTLVAPEQVEKIVFVMSGGTEGVLSPHLTVFTREAVTPETPRQWGLTLGIHHTRAFLPAEIGTLQMVETVAAGVQAAIAEAGLLPQDVHFVQIKCPLITAHDRASNTQPNSYQSMALSRGASALGVAVALGELKLEQLAAIDLGSNMALYSSVASTSAGSELKNCEIMVLGNAPHAASAFVIGHSVMQHALDVAAIHAAIAQTGQSSAQVVNVFAKAEADPAGLILGQRSTMLDDSDISHTRMARAVVGAVIASVLQDPMLYVSGGSEHQGPPGGGPIAVIARRS